MNSDELSLFALVAKSGSISRAAMELGADQSTVSRRISLLEAQIGTRLFHRSGRGVAPTERGRQLLEHAIRVSAALIEAERAMRQSADQGPARLCIAAQPTIARLLFGSLGHALKARYPETRVRFVEGLASHILSRLSDGEIDIAILYLPEHPGALQFDLLLSEEVHLVVPADHPLVGESVDVKTLEQLPLILPSTHHGLRVLMESLAARHGFSPNVVLECDGSISITKRLVAENCGCTILPSAAVIEDVQSGRLRSMRLHNPDVVRDVAIVWPRNRIVPSNLWTVTQIIRDLTVKMVIGGAWPNTCLHPSMTHQAKLVRSSHNALLGNSIG